MAEGGGTENPKNTLPQRGKVQQGKKTYIYIFFFDEAKRLDLVIFFCNSLLHS